MKLKGVDEIGTNEKLVSKQLIPCWKQITVPIQNANW